jgi:hypothetical protein
MKRISTDFNGFFIRFHSFNPLTKYVMEETYYETNMVIDSSLGCHSLRARYAAG